MTTIKEHDDHYDVLDSFCNWRQYSKDDINELIFLISFLIDELDKAEEKYSSWFEKYWELKKKINQIKDVVEE